MILAGFGFVAFILSIIIKFIDKDNQMDGKD